MTLNGLVQIMFYFIVLLGLAKPLGWYMARVYEGRACGLECCAEEVMLFDQGRWSYCW